METISKDNIVHSGKTKHEYPSNKSYDNQFYTELVTLVIIHSSKVLSDH
jgi:hypothetical protein